MRPVIALLTDFGTTDHYVGAMKGVILGICRDAAIVDITHEVAPQDVLGGALQLAAAHRFFPGGTIFVAVVDPGVGTARRAVAVLAGGFTYLGPDNGLLSLAIKERGAARAVEITNATFILPVVSRTFEGRDRFAPAAAWLAAGREFSELGAPVDGLCELELPRPRFDGRRLAGEVLAVDRFGNLITNLDRESLARWRDAPVVSIGGREVPLVETYASAEPDALCALIGSGGRLEVSLNGGSAARALGADRGTPVALGPRQQA